MAIFNNLVKFLYETFALNVKNFTSTTTNILRTLDITFNNNNKHNDCGVHGHLLVSTHNIS